MLRAANQENASLASKLETKDGELKWLQHKYYTTKALHVQELEVVAQRMLLLQVCKCASGRKGLKTAAIRVGAMDTCSRSLCAGVLKNVFFQEGYVPVITSDT